MNRPFSWLAPRYNILGIVLLTFLLLTGGAACAQAGQNKIGVLIPFTGALSDFGQAFQNAANLAADDLAEAGIEVELVIEDTESADSPGVEAANKLVRVDGVQVIVGAASSGVTIPVARSVTIPNQVPQISYASTSPLITNLPDDQGQDFLFRTTPSDALQGDVLARLARDQGHQRVSILFVNNAYGQGLADNFTRHFEEQGGEVVESVPIAEDAAPTYVSELRRADQQDPETLLALSYPEHARVYLRESLEQGLFEDFLFVDGTKSEEIVKAVGSGTLDGMLGTAPGSVETPGREAFRQSYQERYEENPSLPFMDNLYDAVVVSGLAAYKAAQDGVELNGVALRDRLRQVSNPPGEVVGPGPQGLQRAVELIDNGQDINYEGAAGSQDFDDNGDVITPIEIWQYQGETMETLRLEEP